MTREPKDETRDRLGSRSSVFSREAWTAVPPEPPASGLTVDQAIRFLSFGLSPGDDRPESGDRPLDELLARLRRTGGHEWFQRAVEQPPDTIENPPASLLDRASLGVPAIRSLKNSGLRTWRGNGLEDDRLAGLLCYCLSIAAALADHGEILSRQPAREVRGLLFELSRLAPPSWQGLLAEAVRCLDQPPPD